MLRVVGVKKNYATPQGVLEILRGVDFSLEAGASLALMGESGSGKSTLLHLVGALDQADAGDIFLDDMSLATLGEAARAALRRELRPLYRTSGFGGAPLGGAARNNGAGLLPIAAMLGIPERARV